MAGARPRLRWRGTVLRARDGHSAFTGGQTGARLSKRRPSFLRWVFEPHWRTVAGLAISVNLSSCGDSDPPAPERRAFRSIDGHTLSLDIYRPTAGPTAALHPCIVWFFGGGWEVGFPSQYGNHAKRFAKLGFVSVTPDYRVRSRHGEKVTPSDAVEDALAAFAWIREHSAELGIDPERIAAAGGSSGGHLVFKQV